MPQTTVIPAWKATYPIEAPAQKPGGVAVSTALGANAVPNKPTPWQGTETVITSAGVHGAQAEASEEEVHEEEGTEAEGEAEASEEEVRDENGHPQPRRSKPAPHKGRRR